MFRESVEESRDEHVARQAAERVEMNVQKNSPNSQCGADLKLQV
jgi:hypothetical protein